MKNTHANNTVYQLVLFTYDTPYSACDLLHAPTLANGCPYKLAKLAELVSNSGGYPA